MHEDGVVFWTLAVRRCECGIKVKRFGKNKDGSYSGLVDAETANKMLKEWMRESTEISIRAVLFKDKRIMEEIENLEKGEEHESS